MSERKAARIKLLLFDVDGVLTDGKVIVHSRRLGEQVVHAIREASPWCGRSEAGLRVGFLSAETSPTTPHRAAQIGVTLVHQGVRSKIETYEKILATERMEDHEIAYMGDDIVDLAVLGRVGFSAAPADAVAEVKAVVDWVSKENGGQGAARELIETILRAQGLWDEIVARSGESVPAPGSRVEAS